MKFRNEETGQWTKVKKDQFGYPEYQAAADRLVTRMEPGYFAGPIHYYDIDRRTSLINIKLEICRSLGDLIEHTGRHIYIKIER